MIVNNSVGGEVDRQLEHLWEDENETLDVIEEIIEERTADGVELLFY